MAEKRIVNIKGKDYVTVGARVQDFRERYTIDDGWCIVTTVIHRDSEGVVMRAEIVKDGVVVAAGHGEENRKGHINSTSALENCETSAIGRALAAAGFAGSEYASADEVANAISQRPTPSPSAKPSPSSNTPLEQAYSALRSAVAQWTGVAAADVGKATLAALLARRGVNPTNADDVELKVTAWVRDCMEGGTPYAEAMKKTEAA